MARLRVKLFIPTAQIMSGVPVRAAPLPKNISAGLCEVCREIFTRKKPANNFDERSFPHHENIHDLIAASESGCDFCNFLWRKLSAEEKLSLGVDSTSQPLSESHQVSYKLGRGLWSGLGCIFSFMTLTDGNIKKELVFLSSQGGLSSSVTLHSQNYKKEKHNSPRVRSGVAIASGPSDVDDLVLGPQTTTGSTASLEQAKKWITNCVDAHSSCIPPRSKLPTRLIWVGNSGDGALRMCDTEDLPQGTHYMTLSHCWGMRTFLTLTTKNLENFRQSIYLEDLTKVFQDAIHVTRFMGIDYIWIDSLCIIQDSPEDWAKESLLMKDVYSNGYCNVAATHASSGEDGCFVDRSINISPLKINISASQDDSANYFSPGSYQCRDPTLWEDEVTNSPLLQRAWVFQERLLAPRVLHFASNQIFFECQEFRACETHPEDLELLYQIVEPWSLNDGFKPKIQLMLNKALHAKSTSDKRLAARITWMYLLNNYTSCKLTLESDRLMAISGFAKLLNSMMGCRYLAGLWEDNLVAQLVWKSCGESFRATTYLAPSWSWASRSGEVLSYDSDMRDVAGMGPIGHDSHETSSSLVKVLDVNITTISEDPMSQVTSGHLCLRGILIPTILQCNAETSECNFKVRGVELCLVKDVSGEMLEGRLFVAMCLHTTIYFDSVSEYAEGLMLRPTGKEKGQYERVGYVNTTWSNGPAGIAPVCTPLERSSHEKEVITTEFFELYDEETEEYTFSII